MNDVLLHKVRIKPGKEDVLRDWFLKLAEREEEVFETLQNERVFTETAFIEAEGDVSYLYVYMESEDAEFADEAGDEEAYPIDEEHHEVLNEVLVDESQVIEPIGHFVNPHLRG